MRYFALLALVIVCGQPAWADPVSIESRGSGMTRDVAVSKALVSAVEQVTGVTINFSEVSAAAAKSEISNNTRQVDMVQTTQDQIARSAGGRILSYDIESVMPAPEGGLVATVKVQVEVFHAKGISNENRRRIAVANFLSDAVAASSNEMLRDKLLLHLTQSRRFLVVDRSNDDAYNQEMAIVTGPDAAPAERDRAGKVLGADYIVTGHIVAQAARTTGAPAQTSSQTLELTGEVVTSTRPSTLRTIAGSVSADFSVIEIATRQIKFADHVDAVGSNFDEVADQISIKIINAIYPPRLIDISDPSALIINQGGSGMKTGMRFRVMQEGHELFDPYTHESLGKREHETGVIEIGEVSEKISYAKLLTGTVTGAPESFVLRPLAVAAPSPVQEAAEHRKGKPRHKPANAPEAPDTGFKLPFDH